jgi:hypothetical protein
MDMGSPQQDAFPRNISQLTTGKLLYHGIGAEQLRHALREVFQKDSSGNRQMQTL